MYDLSALGFCPFFENQLSSTDHRELNLARIASEHRGSYEVWTPSGGGQAELAGKLRMSPNDSELPAVGDWVVLRDAPAPDRTTIIDRVLARRTVFTRGAAGREAKTQVIAANVDLVFVVCGLDADFNIRRIERYLARIWASGATPAVILNKADLCGDIAIRVAEVESHAAGVEVYVTSALQCDGVSAIHARVTPGTTVAFVGSSGAGKSTLVNALVGETRMPTGDVRASDQRGCHTTTHRQLVLLTTGGILLDTPGMREMQVVDEEGLGAVFEDIADLAGQCRFRDCRHDNEPGCAVKGAVESGALAADRLEHYRQLEREARAFERRHDKRLQRQTERVWGQLHKEAMLLRRWKGGKQ